MTRKLGSWIDGFMQYSTSFSSPAIFRRWTAVAIVAGTLERKVWVFTKGAPLYPNLYIFLVGPPGVGKTHVLNSAARFWGSLPDYHTARTSVTKASLVDELADAKRNILRPGDDPPHVAYNSLLVPIRELGAFLSSYDPDFMGFLTDIYDNQKYGESRRTKGTKLDIEAPMLNILAACTPSYLATTLPEGAWDQGFLSRVLLVSSGASAPEDIFVEGTDDGLPEPLIHDLRAIAKLYGKVGFTEEAKTDIRDWHMAGGPPTPEHPKLVNYNTRRTAHLLKLATVLRASKDDRLIIEREDFEDALAYITDLEEAIPDIFKGMTGGGDSKAIQDVWYLVLQVWAKKKEPIPEGRLYAWLSQRVPTYSIQRVIEAMVKAGTLQQGLINGITVYRPGHKP
jgi:hypothetical protein